MTDQEPTLNQIEPEQEAPLNQPAQPLPSYSYRAMFQLLTDGRAQKVCRQEGRTAWIIDVNGYFYREIYDTQTWLVHYDLLSTEETNAILDKLVSIKSSIEAK